MPQTLTLSSLDELQDLYDGIVEDFNDIDYGQWMAGELDRLADFHKRMFDTSTDPEGKAWRPNAPLTIQQKGHSRILRGIRGRRERNYKGTRRRPPVRFRIGSGVRGFRLATSLTAKTQQTFGDAVREMVQEQRGKAQVTFGTSVEYSHFNDQGTGRIPARPHIGINEQHLDKMTERATDFALAELAK